MRLLRFAFAVLALAFAAPAAAQSGPVGIGFAQAEEGTWYCRGGDPVRALDCARQKCRAEGGGQSCARTAWCYPARWSGLMVVWLADFHTSVPLCGAPTEQALRSALQALCAGSEHATSCSLVLLVDPDGNERAVEDESWPGPAGHGLAPE